MSSTPRLSLLPPIPETAVIPYHPADSFDILAAVLENSFLTMNLRPHHFHTLSKSCDLYALDYNLANGIWGTLKDIARTIHLAADSTCDPHQRLPVYVNPYRLQEINMAAPQILYIEAFTQNLLLAATTRREISDLFGLAQKIGKDALEWVIEAKRRCEVLGENHGWNWSMEKFEPTDLPLLEGGGLIQDGTNLDISLPPAPPNSPVASDENAMILHPTLSTNAIANPDARFSGKSSGPLETDFSSLRI